MSTGIQINTLWSSHTKDQYIAGNISDLYSTELHGGILETVVTEKKASSRTLCSGLCVSAVLHPQSQPDVDG